MTPGERQQAKRDEVEMLLIREGISLAVVLGVLLLANPRVHIWLKQQWGRVQAARPAPGEAAALRELRRDIARMENKAVTGE